MSVIIDYIKNNNITNIEEEFAKFDIKVKFEGDLAIFNYGIEADFSNPIVQEARGIIIDLNTQNVVCWPFRKFGNYSEYYADEIDWTSAQVQEKVDGSIVKLWYYNNTWNWSTNGTIYAKNAPVGNGLNHSFQTLINKTINYKDIDFNSLNKDYTYIFELVSPENRVVVKYNDYKLYHLGTRNNKNGEEYSIDIDIDKPHLYNITTFDECLEAANKLNTTSIVTNEGFVVVDKNYNRIKIKSPAYIALHHLVENGNFSKKRCLELIRNQSSNINTIIDEYPQYKHILLYYQYKLSELYANVNDFVNITKDLYEEYSYDRKAVANIIKTHQYASFGFSALNTNKTGTDLLDVLDVNKLERYINDYIPRDIINELQLR